eukprot:TRINITY_DN5145_c0_g3_i1.p1 TRINITY_DN5145_c0_g3~~TRINITY_DN5145_c0_g3_i1.p1  ORF type:complete len:374 (+),score=22.85 TRINITY_DN5145_c0_g3_i1:81-1202(+)
MKSITAFSILVTACVSICLVWTSHLEHQSLVQEIDELKVRLREGGALKDKQPPPPAKPVVVEPYGEWSRGTWLVGGHYVSSSSHNQIDMFTNMWNPGLFDRELSRVASIGFNVIKISLHEQVYYETPDVLLERVDTLLAIATLHKLRAIVTLLDSSGRDEVPEYDSLYEVYSFKRYWPVSPFPGVPEKRVEMYVKGVLEQFKNDKRILVWDLWEAPTERDVPLLSKIVRWGLEIRPYGSLTTSIVVNASKELSDVQIGLSEVVSYHHTGSLESLKETNEYYSSKAKPVLCASYLSRSQGVTPLTALPLFRNTSTHAITTGLIKGASAFTYPPETFSHPIADEPAIWEHDMIQHNGFAFNYAEAEYTEGLGLNL